MRTRAYLSAALLCERLERWGAPWPPEDWGVGSQPLSTSQAARQAEAEFAQGLRRILPDEFRAQGDLLAHALAAILDGKMPTSGRIAVDGATSVLQRLAGRSITADQAVVSFASGSQLGDVTIGDVAGDHIIKIYLQAGAEGLELSAPASTTGDEVRHRLGLIETHRRRMRVLEQQAAQFGFQCPPQTLMEIEDLGKEIARLSSG